MALLGRGVLVAGSMRSSWSNHRCYRYNNDTSILLLLLLLLAWNIELGPPSPLSRVILPHQTICSSPEPTPLWEGDEKLPLLLLLFEFPVPLPFELGPLITPPPTGLPPITPPPPPPPELLLVGVTPFWFEPGLPEPIQEHWQLMNTLIILPRLTGLPYLDWNWSHLLD